MLPLRTSDLVTTTTQREESQPANAPRCRFCSMPLEHTFADLGTSPLCQRHVTPERFNLAEPFYPLRAYVCGNCFLVQLPGYVAREEIFDAQYAYFSSYSEEMVEDARTYVDMITRRFGFNEKNRIVELASNDGYLLQYFVQKHIPVLGIEPTANTAAAAERKGVPTLVAFFGRGTAEEVLREHGPADLILGNNVLAHVPDINDFVGGMKLLLGKRGVVTMEFPQLLNLVAQNYWDTIYHEHFSYLSFTTVEAIFAAHGMTLFDVEAIPTHGGSIRTYAKHLDDSTKPIESRVGEMKQREKAAGHFDLHYYRAFDEQVRKSKRSILNFFIEAKGAGKRIAGYGAPGKGNTLLNYCGIRTDFMDFTVDHSPHKQGNFLPGTRIPIEHPEKVRETKPDYLFILPWNLKVAIMQQMSYIREWGGKFVLPMPHVEVL